MKRWLLPASALVLVVTACGAGAKPAPRVTETGARVPSTRVIAARRERAAMLEAQRLLRAFVPPPGARRARAPRESGGVLRRSGPTPLSGEVVDVHRFWRVRSPLRTVVAFVRAHGPHGFRRTDAAYGTENPHYLVRSLAWSGGGREPTRYLDETVVALSGRTVIRVDAEVLWIYPRSPSERVPSGTSEIVVRAPKATATVTDHAKVARIVRWFDALPISPPGVVLLCPLEVGPNITLSFRDARGAWLAQAKLPPTGAGICDPIEFTIAGQPQKPLVDRNIRRSFVLRLQRLLGVPLVSIHR